jgi:hypothetical protein
MPAAILPAGADRRLGRQSRDSADCLSAYLQGRYRPDTRPSRLSDRDFDYEHAPR